MLQIKYCYRPNELQKNINEVSDWCDTNATILLPAKTKCMLRATRQKHQFFSLILNLSLKDNRIEQVQEHRHLGSIIYDEFSWRPHITSTCKTISKKSVPVVTAQTLCRHFQARAILLCSHFASPNLGIYCL